MYLGAVTEPYAGHRAVAEHRRDRPSEQEPGTMSERAVRKVDCGQRRVVDEAGVGCPERAQRPAGVLPERRIIDPLGRPEPSRIQAWHPTAELVGVPHLIGDAGPVEHLKNPVHRRDVHVEEQLARLVEVRQAAVGSPLEVVGPVLPAVLGLPRERDAVPGGVVEADHRARRAGRPLAGAARLVDDDDRTTAARQLEGD